MPGENLVLKNSFHTLPTLLETNISPFKITFEDDFLFPRWDMFGSLEGIRMVRLPRLLTS